MGEATGTLALPLFERVRLLVTGFVAGLVLVAIVVLSVLQVQRLLAEEHLSKLEHVRGDATLAQTLDLGSTYRELSTLDTNTQPTAEARALELMNILVKHDGEIKVAPLTEVAPALPQSVATPGTRLQLWFDRSGNVTSAPLDRQGTVFSAMLSIALFVLVGALLLVWTHHSLSWASRRLTRRRLDRDWARLSPEWSKAL